jgi:hypothetical protein
MPASDCEIDEMPFSFCNGNYAATNSAKTVSSTPTASVPSPASLLAGPAGAKQVQFCAAGGGNKRTNYY